MVLLFVYNNRPYLYRKNSWKTKIIPWKVRPPGIFQGFPGGQRFPFWGPSSRVPANSEAASHLAALLRTCSALAQFQAQQQAAKKLQSWKRHRWQRRKYLATRWVFCFVFFLPFFGLVICFFVFKEENGVAFMVKSLSVRDEMIHNLDDFIWNCWGLKPNHWKTFIWAPVFSIFFWGPQKNYKKTCRSPNSSKKNLAFCCGKKNLSHDAILGSLLKMPAIILVVTMFWVVKLGGWRK